MRGISCPAAATSAFLHSFPSSMRCQSAPLAHRQTAPAQSPQGVGRLPLPRGGHWHWHNCSQRTFTASASRNAKRARNGGAGASGDGQLIQLEEDGSDAWRLEPAIQSIRSGGVSTPHAPHTSRRSRPCLCATGRAAACGTVSRRRAEQRRAAHCLAAPTVTESAAAARW